MGSSRFLPLVIAGLLGLFVGWLFGPDVDDVERHVDRRIKTLEEKIDAAAAPAAAVQTTVAGLDQRTTAIATGVQALGNPVEAVGALSAKLDAVAAAATEGKAATDALAQKLDALQAKLDAAPAPAAGGQADALAAGIGNTGAVLLAGQTAIFGEKRLTVASVGAGKAALGAEGAPPADVASGASVDLGDGCSVTLAGVSGVAAYLAPTGCSNAGGAPAAAAPAPAPAAAAPAPAPAAAAPAPTPAPAAPAPAAPADGTPLTIGQTGTFGDKRAFLSRISAADGTAFLFVPGSGQTKVATGANADLGDGCTLTLVSIAGQTATFKANGCAGGAAPAPAEAPAAAPAAAPLPAAAPAAPAPAEAPAPAAAPAAAPAEAAAAPAPTQATPGGAAALTVGQTATFGDKRIFLSRVTPEKAFVVIVGSGPAEVAPGSAADLGGGCSAKLDAITGNVANFTPAGC